MNLARQVESAAFMSSLQKWSQDLGTMLSGVSKPILFGMGGYGFSKELGGEKATGIPDWLLGPAAGLGLAMPLSEDISRSMAPPDNQVPPEEMQQLRLMQALQHEQMLRRKMQQQLAASMGLKLGQFRVPAQQAEQVAARAQKAVQQSQMQQAQQQIQQAVFGQQLKGLFRGLGQAQARKTQQAYAPQGGRR